MLHSTAVMWQSFDILVVGAGLSGAVLAERYASLGKKVLVIEKRAHLGGNCYDFVNTLGIRVSAYGAHIFHTNDEEVQQYIHRFSEWVPYEHRVLSKIKNKYIPIPVNIKTIQQLYDAKITTPVQMEEWLAQRRVQFTNQLKTSEEVGLSRFGPELYEQLFLHYTQKQWEKHPSQLDASVLERIPLRLNSDDRYFTDMYQYLPKHGYTAVFEKMLDHPNIKLLLNTDYFVFRSQVHSSPKKKKLQKDVHLLPFEKTFYTGPIDQFFEFQQRLGSTLEYRSLNFKEEVYELKHKQEFYQPAAVVNFPEPNVPYTRSVEYKHFNRVVDPHAASHQQTVVIRETSTAQGEPYYPVPSVRNQALYEEYRKHAQRLAENGIYFVGRLANYKYFNMDQAIKNALDLFYQLESHQMRGS